MDKQKSKSTGKETKENEEAYKHLMSTDKVAVNKFTPPASFERRLSAHGTCQRSIRVASAPWRGTLPFFDMAFVASRWHVACCVASRGCLGNHGSQGRGGGVLQTRRLRETGSSPSLSFARPLQSNTGTVALHWPWRLLLSLSLPLSRPRPAPTHLTAVDLAGVRHADVVLVNIGGSSKCGTQASHPQLRP